MRLVAQDGSVPWTAPAVGSHTIAFWDGCRAGRLLFQRCCDCKAAIFPPALRCRRCQGLLEWEESGGLGTVYSHTTVWRPATPDLATPYVVAIVELDDGYQMVSSIIDCDDGDVRTGLVVEAKFVAVNDALTLPYFRPRAEPEDPT